MVVVRARYFMWFYIQYWFCICRGTYHDIMWMVADILYPMLVLHLSWYLSGYFMRMVADI